MRVPGLIAAAVCQCLVRVGQAAPPVVPGEGPVDQLRAWLAQPEETRPPLEESAFARAPLARAQAEEARAMLWDALSARLRAQRRAEWDARSIALDGKVMPFEFRVFGAPRPGEGRRLFISMHGGGNAPREVNDRQWRNQVRLYAPDEGVYLAPRAPTDTWNLWHEAHIDAMFDRIIEDAALFEGVGTDRVYLMGYSAGGDGVYQLAPRTADRWAAAAMMAGHPNDASPLGLRNLPFAIHVGADDDGYGRNAAARAWGEKLDELRGADPGGYVHVTELHAGRGHWMNREDAAAVPWMSRFTRDPWPARVVWRQGNVAHERLYWLATGPDQRAPGATVIASVCADRITIEAAEGVNEVTLLLSDELLNLDRAVTVVWAGRPLHEGRVARTIADLARSLGERHDPRLAAMAAVTVKLVAADGGAVRR